MKTQDGHSMMKWLVNPQLCYRVNLMVDDDGVFFLIAIISLLVISAAIAVAIALEFDKRQKMPVRIWKRVASAALISAVAFWYMTFFCITFFTMFWWIFFDCC